ncbi:Nucleoporin Nup43, variant 2 [Entomophthora muscae]|uniref:Nucleoporin Nup43, variant 2 n=1 Tax=Entomophthora muscae TaxID=34485 RepID=A0ACC2TYR6_9FUNG|nr:Nucleoporin Nup43, variant 2 [Entomophthora muscae]
MKLKGKISLPLFGSEYHSSQDSTYRGGSELNENFEQLLEKAVANIAIGVSYKFATGTSGNSGRNRVDIWSALVKESFPFAYHTTPELSIIHKGDVKDIQFWGRDILMTASGNGSVNLFDISSPTFDKTAHLLCRYQAHDKFYGGCSKVKPNPSLGVPFLEQFTLNSGSQYFNYRGGSILSSGYDGSLVLYELEVNKVTHKRKGIATCINDFAWFTPNLASLACSLGQMKLADLRSPRISTFMIDQKGNLNSHVGDFLSISQHQTQPFIFAGGTSTGGIAVFDIRYSGTDSSSSLSYIPSLHQRPVQKVQFCAANPEFLISSSEGNILYLLAFNL